MPKLPKPPQVKLPKPPKPPRSLSAAVWAFSLGIYVYFFGWATGFNKDGVLAAALLTGCIVMLTTTLYGIRDTER
jgi:hypothetical protein